MPDPSPIQAVRESLRHLHAAERLLASVGGYAVAQTLIEVQGEVEDWDVRSVERMRPHPVSDYAQSIGDLDL